MNHSTQGIVLHYFDYSDSSIIAKIYTDRFGLQSYIINGVRKKKAKMTLNLFQSLNILEMEVTYKEKASLQRITDIKVLTSLNYDVDFIKNSIVLFLKEVIYKSIKEEEANKNLFDFLKESIIYLNANQQNMANFHIAFMLELTQHLGFFPHLSDGSYFNLKEGDFDIRPSENTLNLEESDALKQFMNTNWKESNTIKLTENLRKRLLNNLIQFYKIHIEGFGEIKSLEVLQTVMA